MNTAAKEKLIVYYSYSGNNELLAEYLARELKVKAVRIQEKKHRSGVTILLDMFLKRNPEIEPLTVSLNDFSHLILIAPIWNGKVASPLKSLLRKYGHQIKSYSFMTISGGYEKTNQMDDIKTELNNLTGKEPMALCELDVSDLFPKSERRKISKISRYHVKSEDFSKGFQQKLQEALSIQKRLSVS